MKNLHVYLNKINHQFHKADIERDYIFNPTFIFNTISKEEVIKDFTTTENNFIIAQTTIDYKIQFFVEFSHLSDRFRNLYSGIENILWGHIQEVLNNNNPSSYKFSTGTKVISNLPTSHKSPLDKYRLIFNGKKFELTLS